MLKYNKFSHYFKNTLQQELELLAEFVFKPEVCPDTIPVIKLHFSMLQTPEK